MSRTTSRPVTPGRSTRNLAPSRARKVANARANGAAALHAADLAIYRMPGHLIRRLHQVSVSLFMEEMEVAKIDLTQVQFAALSAIQRYPRIDQATLGGVIAYDRATIGGVIDRLEEKRLVRRTLYKENRRVRQLLIQPKGDKLLARIRPLVAKVQSRIVSPLTAAERAVFMRCITKLTDIHNDQSRAPLRPVRIHV